MTSSTQEPDLATEGDVIKDRWKIIKKLGGGGFGEIYECFDLNVKATLAIKLESSKLPKQVLRMEVSVLKKLQGTKHACKCFGYGRNDKYSYVAMTLQGKNLGDLRRQMKNACFSISTTMQLTLQILDSIENIHNIGFLHRDIKPSNFAMGGIPETTRIVFMLDFGLARQYVVPDGSFTVRPPRDVAGFRGTVRYASMNAHNNVEMGRHDDLWSAFYMLVEMITGQLPWRRVKDKEQVGQIKQKYDHTRLLQSLPQELSGFLAHIQELDYFQKPNYELLRTQVRECMFRRNLSLSDPYDWEVNGNGISNNSVCVSSSQQHNMQPNGPTNGGILMSTNNTGGGNAQAVMTNCVANGNSMNGQPQTALSAVNVAGGDQLATTITTADNKRHNSTAVSSGTGPRIYMAKTASTSTTPNKFEDNNIKQQGQIKRGAGDTTIKLKKSQLDNSNNQLDQSFNNNGPNYNTTSNNGRINSRHNNNHHACSSNAAKSDKSQNTRNTMPPVSPRSVFTSKDRILDAKYQEDLDQTPRNAESSGNLNDARSSTTPRRKRADQFGSNDMLALSQPISPLSKQQQQPSRLPVLVKNGSIAGGGGSSDSNNKSNEYDQELSQASGYIIQHQQQYQISQKSTQRKNDNDAEIDADNLISKPTNLPPKPLTTSACHKLGASGNNKSSMKLGMSGGGMLSSIGGSVATNAVNDEQFDISNAPDATKAVHLTQMSQQDYDDDDDDEDEEDEEEDENEAYDEDENEAVDKIKGKKRRLLDNDNLTDDGIQMDSRYTNSDIKDKPQTGDAKSLNRGLSLQNAQKTNTSLSQLDYSNASSSKTGPKKHQCHQSKTSSSSLDKKHDGIKTKSNSSTNNKQSVAKIQAQLTDKSRAGSSILSRLNSSNYVANSVSSTTSNNNVQSMPHPPIPATNSSVQPTEEDSSNCKSKESHDLDFSKARTSTSGYVSSGRQSAQSKHETDPRPTSAQQHQQHSNPQQRPNGSTARNHPNLIDSTNTSCSASASNQPHSYHSHQSNHHSHNQNHQYQANNSVTRLPPKSRNQQVSAANSSQSSTHQQQHQQQQNHPDNSEISMSRCSSRRATTTTASNNNTTNSNLNSKSHYNHNSQLKSAGLILSSKDVIQQLKRSQNHHNFQNINHLENGVIVSGSNNHSGYNQWNHSQNEVRRSSRENGHGFVNQILLSTNNETQSDYSNNTNNNLRPTPKPRTHHCRSQSHLQSQRASSAGTNGSGINGGIGNESITSNSHHISGNGDVHVNKSCYYYTNEYNNNDYQSVRQRSSSRESLSRQITANNERKKPGRVCKYYPTNNQPNSPARRRSTSFNASNDTSNSNTKYSNNRKIQPQQHHLRNSNNNSNIQLTRSGSNISLTEIMVKSSYYASNNNNSNSNNNTNTNPTRNSLTRNSTNSPKRSLYSSSINRSQSADILTHLVRHAKPYMTSQNNNNSSHSNLLSSQKSIKHDRRLSTKSNNSLNNSSSNTSTNRHVYKRVIREESSNNNNNSSTNRRTPVNSYYHNRYLLMDNDEYSTSGGGGGKTTTLSQISLTNTPQTTNLTCNSHINPRPPPASGRYQSTGYVRSKHYRNVIATPTGK